MKSASQIDAYKVWEVISYAWTEIGIEDDECRSLIRKSRLSVEDFRQIDGIVFRDVCASFAVDSFLIFPCMLWMIMPDWGYGQKYLEERIDKWYGKLYWVHFLNPLRLLGYPVAVVMALRYRAKLRAAIKTYTA